MPRVHLKSLLLAVVMLIPSTAFAQWQPNGVNVARGLVLYYSPIQSMTPDGLGGALLTAEELAYPERRASVGRVSPDGSIPAGWPSNAVPASYLSHSSAPDGVGGAYVGRQVMDTTFSFVVLHVLANGSLDPAWPQAGRIVANPATGARTVMQLAADGVGGVYAVTASSFQLPSGDYDGELRAMRLQSSGAPAAGWPEGGIELAQAPYLLRLGTPFLTSAGLVVPGEWEARDPGPVPTGSGPRTPHVVGLTPTGGVMTGWSSYAIPVPLCQSGDEAAMASDGSGGVFFTRVGTSQPRPTLFHMLPSGSIDPAWPSGGIRAASDTAALSWVFHPVSDGAGGCFAYGVSLENGYGSPGHSQLIHVDGSGTPYPGWPVQEPAPDDVSGMSFDMVPDTHGGAFFFWTDPRLTGTVNGHSRVLLAQRFTGSGGVAPYWPVGGKVLVQGPGARSDLRAIPDSHGGAIVSWSDTRRDTSEIFSDLYALGIGPDGSFTTDVPPSPRPRMALAVSPVPMRDRTTITFALSVATHVDAGIFDVTGRQVRNLQAGELGAGRQSLVWDGRDEQGREVPQGVYLVRVLAGGISTRSRVVRLR